jgi:hypothetical protein
MAGLSPHAGLTRRYLHQLQQQHQYADPQTLVGQQSSVFDSFQHASLMQRTGEVVTAAGDSIPGKDVWAVFGADKATQILLANESTVRDDDILTAAQPRPSSPDRHEAPEQVGNASSDESILPPIEARKRLATAAKHFSSRIQGSAVKKARLDGYESKSRGFDSLSTFPPALEGKKRAQANGLLPHQGNRLEHFQTRTRKVVAGDVSGGSEMHGEPTKEKQIPDTGTLTDQDHLHTDMTSKGTTASQIHAIGSCLPHMTYCPDSTRNLSASQSSMGTIVAQLRWLSKHYLESKANRDAASCTESVST